MTRGSSRDRIAAVEAAIAQICQRLELLEKSVAPSSEIDRLNYAFELLADRAPASEVERLNHAFELIDQKAPASEIARLNDAFDLIAQSAPASEVERLNYAIELIANFRASERVVEVPWILDKYRGEKRVLEVGHAFAEEHYLECLANLEIPFLVGIDAAASPRPRAVLPFHQIRGDVLHSCVRPGSFDLVLCVSTIEHIGRDNTRYGLDSGRDEQSPDHQAIRTLADWLGPGGRLLLTVPFGRFEDHGWLINYDIEHLESLIEASCLSTREMTFYGWMPGGWREVMPDDLKDRSYKSLGASHAAGVALVELFKDDPP